MIIDCISDLHGFYPEIEGGDLLIVAGDLTARDTVEEHLEFARWLHRQAYRYTIVVPGNHDGIFNDPLNRWGPNLNVYKGGPTGPVGDPVNHSVLIDQGITIEGLKIWGSPWTLPFCDWHFMLPEDELKKKYDLIPDGMDILITHGPPGGVLDCNARGNRCGSVELRKAIQRIKPKYAVFGHIHESYGQYIGEHTTYINCAHCDEYYIPHRKPIRIEI
jgi:Icc-related predicted phosphoesterase